MPVYAFCATDMAVVALEESFPHSDLTPLLDRISGERLHERGDDADEEACDRVGVDLVPAGEIPSRPACPVEEGVGRDKDGADNESSCKPLSSVGDVLREVERGRLSVCDEASGTVEAEGDGVTAPEGVVDRSVTGSSSAPSMGPTTSGPRGACTLPFISSSVRP